MAATRASNIELQQFRGILGRKIAPHPLPPRKKLIAVMARHAQLGRFQRRGLNCVQMTTMTKAFSRKNGNLSGGFTLIEFQLVLFVTHKFLGIVDK